MLAAVVVYIGIGLVIGAVARLQQAESSLAGVLGSGGVGGAIGGIFANIVSSGSITLDGIGVAGSAILGIVAVLVVRIADRKEAAEEDSPTSDG
ncbi:MAG: hypothetical protein WD532_00535 [Acidimicrobiia bacterium]